MKEYRAEIKSSSMELSKKDRIRYRQAAEALPLEELCRSEALVIHNPQWIVVHVENDKAKDGMNKEYDTYLIVDEDGTYYKTGSESLFSELSVIHEEMEGEEYDIKVFQSPSKNYKDKFFLTCTVI